MVRNVVSAVSSRATMVSIPASVAKLSAESTAPILSAVESDAIPDTVRLAVPSSLNVTVRLSGDAFSRFTPRKVASLTRLSIWVLSESNWVSAAARRVLVARVPLADVARPRSVARSLTLLVMTMSWPSAAVMTSPLPLETVAVKPLMALILSRMSVNVSPFWLTMVVVVPL